jgi:hypothetical protein
LVDSNSGQLKIGLNKEKWYCSFRAEPTAETHDGPHPPVPGSHPSASSQRARHVDVPLALLSRRSPPCRFTAHGRRQPHHMSIPSPPHRAPPPHWCPLFKPRVPPHSDFFYPHVDSTPSYISTTSKHRAAPPTPPVPLVHPATGAPLPAPESTSPSPPSSPPGELPTMVEILLNPQSLSSSSSYSCCRITPNLPPFIGVLSVPQSAATPPQHCASTSHRLMGEPHL